MTLLPGDGSRCFDCAFTRGTEANAAPHTTIQAFMCVLAHDQFRCHVKDQVCAGYVELAAQSAPVKPNHMVGMVAELWNECVRVAVASERKADASHGARGEPATLLTAPNGVRQQAKQDASALEESPRA